MKSGHANEEQRTIWFDERTLFPPPEVTSLVGRSPHLLWGSLGLPQRDGKEVSSWSTSGRKKRAGSPLWPLLVRRTDCGTSRRVTGRNLICKGFAYKQGHEEKRIRDFLKPGILKSFSLQFWTLGFSFSTCCPAPPASKDRQCGGSHWGAHVLAGGGRRWFFLMEIVLKKQTLLSFPSPYTHTQKTQSCLPINQQFRLLSKSNNKALNSRAEVLSS